MTADIEDVPRKDEALLEHPVSETEWKPQPCPPVSAPAPADRFAGAGWQAGRHILRMADAALSLLLLPVLNRKLRIATAAALTSVVVWSVGPTRSALQAALATAQRPLHQRAAFTWSEDLAHDLTSWIQYAALSPADDGVVRVRGLALHARTMALKTYGVDFSARAEKKSIGWVIRAADPGNYVVFKLVERGRSPKGLRFDLVRYAVVGGEPPPPSERQAVPVVVIGPPSAFLDVSVRVTEEQVITLVNGFGVDTWKPRQAQAGGLGFFAENGETFLVKSLTISGNDDSLGLFLWGAEETFRSLRRNLHSLTVKSQIVARS